MLFFQCFGVVALLTAVATATDAPAEHVENCDGYVDEVPHLQPFSGDCSKLKADSHANNDNLHGKSWIVHYDSHKQAKPTTCEVMTYRIDGDTLYSAEVVTKQGTTVVLHEEATIDQNQEGVFRGEDEVGMVVHTCGANTMCFAECGKLEEPQDGKQYGAHVYCASTSKTVDGRGLKCFHDAETKVRQMGLDVTLKRMKGDCEGRTEDEYEASHCHKYMDVIPHHQPISGNCDGLKPLANFDPSKLNGMSWVVQRDSHAQANTDTCETFETRYADNTLETHEIVEKGHGRDKVTVNLRESMTATQGDDGYTFTSDESAVFAYASDDLSAICFAECGKLEEPVDGKEYGAHVFCGTTNVQMTDEQKQAFDKAQQDVNDMGIDVTLKPMKGYCRDDDDDRK